MLKSACRCISNFAAYSPRHHHRKKRDWRGEKVWSDLIMAEKGKVCVTGAGGYVASWVVKLLLSKGYIVHGTVELMEPAVKGTLNVLKACTEAKVKRVVVVSSGSAVMRNPRWPKGKVKDETCWSDKEYCRTTENWYCLSKTEAETEALEYAKKSGLDVVRVCPTLVLGPILQSTINASSLVLIKLLKEGYESLENKHRMIVDARDVAEALLLAYEQPEAEGRYICTAHMIKMQDLVENLRSIYPYYNYPKNFTEGEETENLSSEKLQRLGWNYRPLEETLVDSIKSYKEAGILD
ncbi:cinnamoyl-CoA reductase 2-like isoform X4 [Vitis riparia]|uniref:cinnamoyl-CoA reductase 2-like isoform X4 n=1 Tax=Vitis riparia TaxID=96939 RepID=UPI00155AE2CF|nr:cinnamoyl-CoA reductase 2-like isoform X4 [Vitis riparia]